MREIRGARKVLIVGDGVAAYCCARLLKRAGFRVALAGASPDSLRRPRVPAVMLSDRALALIRDVFEQPGLFAESHHVEKRTVAWGANADAVAVPHSGVVVSEDALLENLARGFEAETVAMPDFVVHTVQPLPVVAEEYRFGARRAVAAEVAIKISGDGSGCWIESLPSGWLFLIPDAAESGWLLAVGSPPDALLEESRIISPRIDLKRANAAEFAASPRIVSPLWADDWLACGTVALGFDPICGDGIAQAVREAILASAVLRAIADGGDTGSLCAHYEARLTAGMLRHLGICTDFYRRGGASSWWRSELELMTEGQRWCSAKLADAGEPRYQLRDFVLELRST